MVHTPTVGLQQEGKERVRALHRKAVCWCWLFQQLDCPVSHRVTCVKFHVYLGPMTVTYTGH